MNRSAAARLERATDSRMLADVRAGLARAQKELSPKYFYDERGSRLFEEITRLPEYYPTRTERALLREVAPTLVASLRPRTLVELGAGNAEKSRIILDAMRAAGVLEMYVPVDVSADFLAETAARLRVEYPELRVVPGVADITERVEVPRGLRTPVLYAFLGSTIGNLEDAVAVRLLRRIHGIMEPGDRFLLGFDLKKDASLIEAAYNDSQGLTAEFNKNMLHVLNAAIGANFDPDAFAHRAFYDQGAERVEMHLVSRHDHVVTIPGIGSVRFRAGESVRTEISAKYDRRRVERLLALAGLMLDDWHTDARGYFALATAARAP